MLNNKIETMENLTKHYIYIEINQGWFQSCHFKLTFSMIVLIYIVFGIISDYQDYNFKFNNLC